LKVLFKKYYPRFIEILKENGLEVNLLLLVALVTFVVMWVDLDSDLAIQKNEIDSVVATLTNSINTLSIDVSSILIIEPPFLGILTTYNFNPTNTDIIDFPKGRSPPLQIQSSC
jgi:hypothetical protein